LFFYIFLAALFFYNFLLIFSDKGNKLSPKLKEAAREIILFSLCAYACVFFLSGPEVANSFLKGPLEHFALRQGLASGNFWPNLINSIAELERPSLKVALDYLGGAFVFWPGILACLAVFFLSLSRGVLSNLRERDFIAAALLAWLIAGTFLCYFGRRFILFLAVPIALSLCAGLEMLYNSMVANQQRLYFLRKLNPKFYRAFLGCFFLAAAFIPLHNASSFSYDLPINRTWVAMLTYIRDNTPRQSIINTNWSEGEYIMAIAKRGTIMDAHWKYGSVVPYWFCRALLSDSEEEAYGIIRMINSGGGLAITELSEALNYDRPAALELLRKLILLTKEQGQALLTPLIHDRVRLNKILGHIYDVEHPVYLLVHYSMPGYMEWMSKAANWNLNGPAAASYRFYTDYSQKKFLGPGSTVLFNNGIEANISNLTAIYRGRLGASSGPWLVAGNFIFADREGIKENGNPEGDANYSVLLRQLDAMTYKATLLSSPLARSLFFKLYFLEGLGLKHFKLAHHESRQGNSDDIYLYKVE
jgi:dolichyl-diphosphooligosaccharide--protein glycosyltransferase